MHCNLKYSTQTFCSSLNDLTVREIKEKGGENPIYAVAAVEEFSPGETLTCLKILRSRRISRGSFQNC